MSQKSTVRPVKRKPYHQVRLPEELFAQAARLAQEESRTANGQVVQLVREALAARQARNG
jgi:hypothetical protein